MFDKVVFAGGGNRCWWQAGFWDALAQQIELRPRVIAGVSAGAATACLVHANESRRALAYYDRALAGRWLNVDVAGLVRRNRPLFPHAEIYRKALRVLLGGEHFRQLQWNAPEIRVVFARLPVGMSQRQAVVRGSLAYRRDRHHPQMMPRQSGTALGFSAQFRRVQECRSERELVELLAASAASPPFTPLGLVDDEPAIDGGMVDSLPVAIVDDIPGSTLVLATRHYPDHAPVFVRQGRVYVRPSRPVTLAGWDYTRPRRFHAVYEHGWADGLDFLRTFAWGSVGAEAWTPLPHGVDVVQAEREAQARREHLQLERHRAEQQAEDRIESAHTAIVRAQVDGLDADALHVDAMRAEHEPVGSVPQPAPAEAVDALDTTPWMPAADGMHGGTSVGGGAPANGGAPLDDHDRRDTGFGDQDGDRLDDGFGDQDGDRLDDGFDAPGITDAADAAGTGADDPDRFEQADEAELAERFRQALRARNPSAAPAGTDGIDGADGRWPGGGASAGAVPGLGERPRVRSGLLSPSPARARPGERAVFEPRHDASDLTLGAIEESARGARDAAVPPATGAAPERHRDRGTDGPLPPPGS